VSFKSLLNSSSFCFWSWFNYSWRLSKKSIILCLS